MSQSWKRVDCAEVDYQLTGESVLTAATIPSPPTSKQPTVIRITQTNDYGFVDAELFVRIGNPKAPLGASDFDAVDDWLPAPIVEDLLWIDAEGDWAPREADAEAEGQMWCGTYEAELQFPPGKHLIELKFISRLEHVCSIVLSDWKVSVK